LDESVFKSIRLARQVGSAGLTYPAVYNAANEQAVDAFHERKIGFLDILDIIEETISQHSPAAALTLEGVLEAELWARATADSLIAARQ
jgi:1-deoxy-D-xylulose-5-phosphate reductoisomerase